MTTVVNYNAPPTVAAFMNDNSKVRCLLGPVGSGKTTGMVIECARRMAEELPNSQGIRETRVAIVRNTSQQLRQTVLPEIEKWLQAGYQYKVTDSTLKFDFRLPDGTRVKSDWMLIPLDTPQDIRRLLSLNLSFAWVSEFREVPVEIIEALFGRVGRFRSVGMSKVNYFGIMMESNYPDEDSEWYKKLELELPPTWKVFKQPGGMDPGAENRENLRPDYYEDLIASNTSDWADVYVHAKYGKSQSGQAVFRASFRPEFHVVYTPLNPTKTVPLMIGQDFGRTPASLIGQVDSRGRLLIFQEVTGVDMGIEQFATSLLRPKMFERFSGYSSFMVCDPTGKDKNNTNEQSPFDVLKRLGFTPYGAPTNNLEPRLRAVEQLLLRHVDGGPMLVIDGTHCPQLVQAMKSQYRYRRKQNKELEDKPDKTHPWSDLADCLQYMALSTNANYTGKVMMDSRPRPRRPAASAAGWT
jgi:hypothetical protein